MHWLLISFTIDFKILLLVFKSLNVSDLFFRHKIKQVPQILSSWTLGRAEDLHKNI